MTLLTAPDSDPAIVPIRQADVEALPISWRARLDAAEIQQALRMAPGASVWNPASLEYAIALPWRHRHEIVHVAELAAIRDPERLLRGVSAAASEAGAKLTLVVEVDEKRPESFYTRCGFEHLEQVVTFRMDTRRDTAHALPRTLRFDAVHPFDDATRAILIGLDHAAFPWLWWNSEAEFLTYSVLPGVATWIGYDGATPVSYIGVTMAEEWGHIDRIAVDPTRQGEGFGWQTLAAAINAMARHGVRTVGLSTQSTNERSQRLYRRFGFERTRDTDYDLWGDIIHRAPGLDLQATERAGSPRGR
ncbi:MAG: GNAT family N-acetyltransferase [Thermomicrobiales bacterium]|nr:GNAT family N-acetyltransferase [Thermomicrobiales bacterium]